MPVFRAHCTYEGMRPRRSSTKSARHRVSCLSIQMGHYSQSNQRSYRFETLHLLPFILHYHEQNVEGDGDRGISVTLISDPTHVRYTKKYWPRPLHDNNFQNEDGNLVATQVIVERTLNSYFIVICIFRNTNSTTAPCFSYEYKRPTVSPLDLRRSETWREIFHSLFPSPYLRSSYRSCLWYMSDREFPTILHLLRLLGQIQTD